MMRCNEDGNTVVCQEKTEDLELYEFAIPGTSEKVLVKPNSQ